MHSDFHQKSHFSFQDSTYPVGQTKVHHDDRTVHLHRHPLKNVSQLCFDPRQVNGSSKLTKGGRKKLEHPTTHTAIVWTPEECMESQTCHLTNPTYQNTFSMHDCLEKSAPGQVPQPLVETPLNAPFGLNYDESTANLSQGPGLQPMLPPPYATQTMTSLTPAAVHEEPAKLSHAPNVKQDNFSPPNIR